MHKWLNIRKLIDVMHYININRTKDKNHMIISTDAERASDRVQHPSMIKTVQKIVTGGLHLNLIKATYDKPTVNTMLNG